MDLNKEAMIRKLKQNQFPLYVIVVLAYMLIAFSRGAPAIMGPDLIKDLQLTAAQWGLVGLAFFWTYAIGNAPSGAIADIVGPRKTVLACLLLLAGGCYIFSAAQSLTMVIVGRMVVAVGTAGLMIAGIKLISSWFTVKQFPLYYGGYLGLGGLGSVFATAPLQLLMNSYGWRTSFVIIAAGTLAMMVVAHFFVKDRPADIGLPTPDELAGEEAPQEKKTDAPTIGWMAATRQLLAMPRLWIIGLYFLGSNSTGQVIASMWGGILLANVYGFDKATISSILTISAFGLVAGSLVAGWICKRIGSTGVMLSTGVLFLVTWLYMLLNLRSLSVLELQVIYSIIGFVQMYAVVGGMSCVRELISGDMVGTAIGGVNTFSWIFGAGLFNQIWGLIIDAVAKGRTPYPVEAFTAAMWVQTGILVITLVCAATMWKLMRKPKVTMPNANA
ncbi:MAG TPA: MFS transporter [Negativicutes bacterium]|jgi:sugar phosphate permease